MEQQQAMPSNVSNEGVEGLRGSQMKINMAENFARSQAKPKQGKASQAK